MNLIEPLVPKNPDGILRVILPGRISTRGQDVKSIASQQDDAEAWLRRCYSQPVKLTLLGEQASGWLAERESVIKARTIIEAGECDLVLVGELREIFRNPGFQWKFVYDCLDDDTRFISVHDCIDTADETWEVMMHAAAMRHGLEVPTTRRRVRRKATYSFSKGGMVSKIKFGYRKLTRDEAASGKHGPVGLRIAKVSDWTPTILEMRRRYLAGIGREMIAEWLNAENIETGPFATLRKWTGRLVMDLLTDPILSGQRRFRKNISKLIYKSGKHKSRPNPKAPAADTQPSLAHMTVEEQQDILDYLAARKKANKNAQKCGKDSPLWNMPRSRTLWPGQAVRCSACEGLMYRYGLQLKCQNALPGGPKTCWNHVLVSIDTVHKKILPVIVRFLDRDPKSRKMIATAAWRQYQRDRTIEQRTTGGLESLIADLRKQGQHLAAAIAKGGELESLLSLLKEVESQLRSALEERERCVNRQADFGVFESAEDIEKRFDEALPMMAARSREYADLLRKLIPRFLIRPVQARDSGQVRPRAELTLSTAAWNPDGKQPVEESVAIDLFEPPLHIQRLHRCQEARQTHPHSTLHELASIVGIGHMTVKRALDYARRMEKAGASDPYVALCERPSSASRWRKRQCGDAGSSSKGDGP